MLCLNSTDVIEGGASVASVVDYHMSGLVGTTFTQLAAGTLSDTLTTALYTAGAAVSIVNITLVNTHNAAVNVTLRLDPANGGNPRYIIPETISLGAGYSLHTDGTKITVMDTNGGLVTGVNVSDAAYDATSWDGVTTIAPSKNAVRDEFEKKVDASAVITDNRIVRGDGGARGVQESTISVDDSGRMTNPSQPAFLAIVTTAQLNVTGDGTIYNITGAFWTEVFDQGNDFSNGTFTAPITGRYILAGNVYLAGITASHTLVSIYVITSNRNYNVVYMNAANIKGGDIFMLPYSTIVDMDTNDTAYLRINVYYGTKVVDVQIVNTAFGGTLLC